MAATTTLDGSTVGTTRIRARATGDQGITGLSQGANGQMEQGGIIFEDPTDDLVVSGWMTVEVDEPDCTTQPRLFTGFVGDRNYARGEHYRVDGQHQIDTTINDLNVLLTADVFTESDANRPLETDDDRVAWLLGSTSPLYNIVFDTGWIATTASFYDAADYRNKTPADVLNDLCGGRDYIFFVQWDPSASKNGLFLSHPDAATFTSTLKFSNVESDIDDTTTFWAYLDPSTDVTPDEVYCRVVYIHKGNQVTVHSPTTHAAFFSWMPANMHRTIVVTNDRIGSATLATTRANLLLAHYGVERHTLTFTTRLPNAVVGLIQAGMRFQSRFLHLPELSSFTYRRVETITYVQTQDRRDFYDVTITASLNGLSVAPGTGGGSTTPSPFVPGGHWWYGSGTFGPLDAGGSSRGPGDGQTLTFTGNDDEKTFLSGEQYTYHLHILLGAGGYSAQYGLGDLGSVGVATWGPLRIAYTSGPHEFDIEHTDDGTFTVTPSTIGTFAAVFTAADLFHTGTAFGSFDFWIDPVGWVSSSCPLPMQWRYGEVVTMAGAVGTAACSYQAGSLKVYVDHLPISQASYVETDPTAGTFTLNWVPDADETVTVDYQGGG